MRNNETWEEWQDRLREDKVRSYLQAYKSGCYTLEQIKKRANRPYPGDGTYGHVTRWGEWNDDVQAAKEAAKRIEESKV